MGRYLGIDIGGTEIKYGIFDENGNEFIEESGSAKSVRDDLDKIIDVSYDSICFYELESLKYVSKEQIGMVKNHSNLI